MIKNILASKLVVAWGWGLGLTAKGHDGAFEKISNIL